MVGDWAGRDGRRDASRSSSRRSRGCSSTEKGAPFTLGGFYDAEQRRGALRASRCPKLLSLLADHDPNADGHRARLRAGGRTARRSTSCAARSRPWSGIGTGLALLGVVFFVTWLRQAPIAALAVVLPRGDGGRARCRSSRSIAGWITTEVGRQPWIVYKVMRTSQAVTSANGLEVGYAVLIAVYVGLGAAVFWLLRRLARRRPRRRCALMLPELCIGLVDARHHRLRGARQRRLRRRASGT